MKKIIVLTCLLALVFLARLTFSAEKGLRNEKPATKTETIASGDEGDTIIRVAPQETEKTVEIESGQNTTASQKSSTSIELTIPFFVKAGGVLAVLVGFVFFIRWLRAGAAGTAVGEVVDLADSALAKQLRAMKTRADTAVATNRVTEANAINADIAEFEAIRGKLAAKAPPKD